MLSPVPKRPPILDLTHLNILRHHELIIIGYHSSCQYHLSTTQVSFRGLAETTQALLLEQGYAPPIACDGQGSLVCPVSFHHQPTVLPIELTRVWFGLLMRQEPQYCPEE